MSTFPNLAGPNAPSWWATASVALRADVPAILWGPPGVGKTARVISSAAAAGVFVEVVIGSQIDPTDLARPVVWEGKVKLCPAPWAERLAAAAARGQPTMLYVDELSTAPPAVQAALLRVMHERQVGDLDLRGTRVVAAGNRADLGAGVFDLAGAMANRFAHFEATVDQDEWSVGLLAGFGRARTDAQAKWAAVIAAFLRHRPATLLAPPNDPGAAGGAWPSPRSWDNLVMALGCLEDTTTESVMISALVGDAAATELTAWRLAHDLPDPAAVLSGEWLPSKTIRGDIVRAALEGAVAMALHKMAVLPPKDAEVFHAACWTALLQPAVRSDVAVVVAKAFVAGASVAKVSVTIPYAGAELLGALRRVARFRRDATGKV